MSNRKINNDSLDPMEWDDDKQAREALAYAMPMAAALERGVEQRDQLTVELRKLTRAIRKQAHAINDLVNVNIQLLAALAEPEGDPAQQALDLEGRPING